MVEFTQGRKTLTFVDAEIDCQLTQGRGGVPCIECEHFRRGVIGEGCLGQIIEEGALVDLELTGLVAE
ncbi:MAG: hypothetical protein KKH12_15885 [Gammaproteobacteria bacterium]|nr:hypothetical protein [Gammaproteobacteria bacterium]